MKGGGAENNRCKHIPWKGRDSFPLEGERRAFFLFVSFVFQRPTGGRLSAGCCTDGPFPDHGNFGKQFSSYLGLPGKSGF